MTLNVKLRHDRALVGKSNPMTINDQWEDSVKSDDKLDVSYKKRKHVKKLMVHTIIVLFEFTIKDI